eukprot:SAG31_NODE_634_length_13365_cov_182.161767_1_plen_1104_part_00
MVFAAGPERQQLSPPARSYRRALLLPLCALAVGILSVAVLLHSAGKTLTASTKQAQWTSTTNEHGQNSANDARAARDKAHDAVRIQRQISEIKASNQKLTSWSTFAAQSAAPKAPPADHTHDRVMRDAKRQQLLRQQEASSATPRTDYDSTNLVPPQLVPSAGVPTRSATAFSFRSGSAPLTEVTKPAGVLPVGPVVTASDDNADPSLQWNFSVNDFGAAQSRPVVPSPSVGSTLPSNIKKSLSVLAMELRDAKRAEALGKTPPVSASALESQFEEAKRGTAGQAPSQQQAQSLVQVGVKSLSVPAEIKSASVRAAEARDKARQNIIQSNFEEAAALKQAEKDHKIDEERSKLTPREQKLLFAGADGRKAKVEAILAAKANVLTASELAAQQRDQDRQEMLVARQQAMMEMEDRKHDPRTKIRAQIAHFEKSLVQSEALRTHGSRTYDPQASAKWRSQIISLQETLEHMNENLTNIDSANTAYDQGADAADAETQVELMHANRTNKVTNSQLAEFAVNDTFTTDPAVHEGENQKEEQKYGANSWSEQLENEEQVGGDNQNEEQENGANEEQVGGDNQNEEQEDGANEDQVGGDNQNEEQEYGANKEQIGETIAGQDDESAQDERSRRQHERHAAAKLSTQLQRASKRAKQEKAKKKRTAIDDDIVLSSVEKSAVTAQSDDAIRAADDALQALEGETEHLDDERQHQDERILEQLEFEQEQDIKVREAANDKVEDRALATQQLAKKANTTSATSSSEARKARELKHQQAQQELDRAKQEKLELHAEKQRDKEAEQQQAKQVKLQLQEELAKKANTTSATSSSEARKARELKHQQAQQELDRAKQEKLELHGKKQRDKEAEQQQAKQVKLQLQEEAKLDREAKAANATFQSSEAKEARDAKRKHVQQDRERTTKQKLDTQSQIQRDKEMAREAREQKRQESLELIAQKRSNMKNSAAAKEERDQKHSMMTSALGRNASVYKNDAEVDQALDQLVQAEHDAAEEQKKELEADQGDEPASVVAKRKRDAKRQHMQLDADRKKDPLHKNPMSMQNMYATYGEKSKSSIALDLRNAAREKLLAAENARVEAILSKWQNEPISGVSSVSS